MYHDNPTSYEELIDNAKLSFNRNEDLLKVIEKICHDDWMDAESTAFIKECFLQKQ